MQDGASSPRLWYQRGCSQVPVQVLGCGLDAAHHVLVRCEALQLFPAHQAQETHRIVGALVPDARG